MIPWIAVILAGLALALTGAGRRLGFYVFAASYGLWAYKMAAMGAELPFVANGTLAALALYLGATKKWIAKTK